MSEDWNAYRKLVVSNLEDHETRIRAIEIAMQELRIDSVKLTLRYSFLGSLSATLAVLIPALIYLYVK